MVFSIPTGIQPSTRRRSFLRPRGRSANQRSDSCSCCLLWLRASWRVQSPQLRSNPSQIVAKQIYVVLSCDQEKAWLLASWHSPIYHKEHKRRHKNQREICEFCVFLCVSCGHSHLVKIGTWPRTGIGAG